MANRSYLFSVDFNRSERGRTVDDIINGISEWGYIIPLSYKILISCNVTRNRSLIWKLDEDISFIGEMAPGINKLEKFLIEIKEIESDKELHKIIDSTIEFLKDKSRNLRYFQLECGEIWEMSDEKFDLQNEKIFNEIKNIDSKMIEFITDFKDLKNKEKVLLNELENTNSKGLVNILNGNKKKKDNLEIEIKKIEKQVIEKIKSLGITNWSPILYFNLMPQKTDKQ